MIARTITFANLAISAMNQEFPALLPRDFAPGINSFPLRIVN
jgi:hypothetical protein